MSRAEKLFSLNPYRVRRDHDDKWKVFVVDCPIPGGSMEWGVGVQFSWRGVVRGISLTWVR